MYRVTRKFDSSLGFGPGGSARDGELNWGLRKSVRGHRRRPAASGGPGSSVRSCGHGEAREGERSSGRASSPPCGASGVLVRLRGAVERQRGELPKRGGDGGGGE
jgi:hypothetical protein